jgi:hypothetical protein
MDVATGLRGIGLGQYESAFRENDVRTDVLPSLTAEDLREIGAASVGDRGRLLDAVAALREGGARVPATTEAPGPSAAPPPLEPTSGA